MYDHRLVLTASAVRLAFCRGRREDRSTTIDLVDRGFTLRTSRPRGHQRGGSSTLLPLVTQHRETAYLPEVMPARPPTSRWLLHEPISTSVRVPASSRLRCETQIRLSRSSVGCWNSWNDRWTPHRDVDDDHDDDDDDDDDDGDGGSSNSSRRTKNRRLCVTESFPRWRIL